MEVRFFYIVIRFTVFSESRFYCDLKLTYIVFLKKIVKIKLRTQELEEKKAVICSWSITEYLKESQAKLPSLRLVSFTKCFIIFVRGPIIR